VDEDIRFDSTSVLVAPMNEVTRVLSAIEEGDPQAAKQLLPFVYDELRRLGPAVCAEQKAMASATTSGWDHRPWPPGSMYTSKAAKSRTARFFLFFSSDSVTFSACARLY
jgi:ECF sigma factor